MNSILPPILRLFAASLGTIFSVNAAEPEPSTMSASELASRLSAKQQDGNSIVRLRMETSGAAKSTLQLQIKSRATRAGTDLVYQVLWPKERKGESVLLRKSGNRAPTGAIYAPSGGVRPLNAGQMDDRLFGSALSYEDAIENFFAWDQQAIVGTEVVDRVTCQILESKPGKSGHSSYSSVRTWVDTRRLVPLRVEKYAGSGRPARRIETTRVVTDDAGRAIPANLTISGGGDAVTELDGSRIKHGVTFSEDEFTPEGLQKAPAARGSSEQ